MANTIAKKSNQVFCFHALIIPAFTPITVANSIAKNVNSKVAVICDQISLEIGAFVCKDVPKSTFSKSVIYTPYCTKIGSFQLLTYLTCSLALNAALYLILTYSRLAA